jgi:predicted nucleotide-binding protein (sugar kinase/HSP70/actin superfamily)
MQNQSIKTCQKNTKKHHIAGKEHYKVPVERPFTIDQRDNTTILLGGITPGHDYLIEGSLQGLGFKCKALPNTDLTAFNYGRENGNNGFCNPTYFTSGNLAKFLKDLEARGMTRKEIIEKYVFLTTGCNAPCRFGMIEDQYRLVLRNIGFEGFRVIVFQKSGGMKQQVKGDAIDINLRFFLALVNAIHLGDLVNELTCKLRPYEVVEGATEAAKKESLEYLHDILKNKKHFQLKGIRKLLLEKISLSTSVEFIGVLLEQITSKYFVKALKVVRRKFEAVEVDHLRLKTKVKLTGEFWAMTSQSQGNYNMMKFLENEGAEVIPEPVATYLLYMFSKHMLRLKDRKDIVVIPWSKPVKKLLVKWDYYKKYLLLSLGQKLYQREYSRLVHAIGGPSHHLLDIKELQQLSDPYYNIRIEGGEGYMEIAKNIYYHLYNLTHMVLSIKPFGCMPSTISDAVQVAVTERYKEMIFIPIETSGEGEINAHSRVQMALADAKYKARKEFHSVLEKCNKRPQDLRSFVNIHPELKNPMNKLPQKEGVTGTAANFILHVNELMESEK